MAYLKEIWSRCERSPGGCSKRAVVELMTRRNEHYGQYCRSHGAQALKARQRIEVENDELIKQRPDLAEKLA